MSKIGINIAGLGDVKKFIEGKNKAITDGLNDEMNAFAIDVERTAKKNAPVNFGRLRQSIKAENDTYLTKNVTAGVNYAPFVEFGTGGKVSIPAGAEEMAAQFKGKKSGTFKDMLDDLKVWCKKKGIDENAAYAIAVKILRNGVKAQPFLFPAFLSQKDKFLRRVKQLIK